VERRDRLAAPDFPPPRWARGLLVVTAVLTCILGASTAFAQVARVCTDPTYCYPISSEPVVPTPADAAVLTVQLPNTLFGDVVALQEAQTDPIHHQIFLVFHVLAPSPSHPREARYPLPRLPAGTYQIHGALLIEVDPFPITHMADLTISAAPTVPVLGDPGRLALGALLVFLGASAMAGRGRESARF
jgi:hypothetical protein